MGCSSCGQRAAVASAKYPYEAVMPDGSKSLVSSAADERVQRQNVQARMRQEAAARGYSAQPR